MKSPDCTASGPEHRQPHPARDCSVHPRAFDYVRNQTATTTWPYASYQPGGVFMISSISTANRPRSMPIPIRLCCGDTRPPATDRHQVWLRHSAVRRLHRASGWEGIRSCSTLFLWRAASKSPPSKDGRTALGKTVQTAWQEVDWPQLRLLPVRAKIMAATALLKESPHPDEAQILCAMDGILCRCGTYTHRSRYRRRRKCREVQ